MLLAPEEPGTALERTPMYKMNAAPPSMILTAPCCQYYYHDYKFNQILLILDLGFIQLSYYLAVVTKSACPVMMSER